MTSSTKVFKSGNSTAVRLSKAIVEAAGLNVNDQVTVQFNSKDGSIVIKPAKKKLVHDNFSKLRAQSMEEDKEALDYLKDR